MRSIKFPNAELVPVRRFVETGNVDRYGNPVSAWIVSEPLRAAVSDKATEVHLTPGRELIDFDFTLYLEAGQTVLAADRLTVRGHECKVVVQQSDWVSPFVKWFAGSTVSVKAAEG